MHRIYYTYTHKKLIIYLVYKMKIEQNFSDIKEQLQSSNEFEKELLIANFIKHLLSKLIGKDNEFDQEKSFFDMGMDSILILQFKVLLEKYLRCTLSTEVIYQYNNTKQLTQYIISKI